MPNSITRAPPATSTSRGNSGELLGNTAVPPGVNPSQIVAFSSAIASMLPRWPICAGAIAVMTATSGRARRDSGAISPGWFMPISTTATPAFQGSRASVSGTPQ